MIVSNIVVLENHFITCLIYYMVIFRYHYLKVPLMKCESLLESRQQSLYTETVFIKQSMET